MSNVPRAMRISYFAAVLGMELTVVDDRTHGTVSLDPAMWVPGTKVPRIGLLTTFVDLVAAFPPTGGLSPTIDIRTTLVGRPPSDGQVHLVSHPLKHGRRLHTAEVLLDDGRDVFARATATFLSDRPGRGRPGPGLYHPPVRPLPFESSDGLFRLRQVDEHTTEMDLVPEVTNGPGQTIFGGAQAAFAEMAAERALRPCGVFTAVDLDIRYLGPATVGPIAGTGTILTREADHATVRVTVTDRGNADRLVAFAVVILRATRP